MKHSLRQEWLVGALSALIAIGAVVVGTAYGRVVHAPTHEKVTAWICAGVLVVVGGYAVRHLALASGRTLARKSSLGAGATLRYAGSGFGFVVLLFALFAILGVSLGHLLIGAGAVGVILGIAAQQSLANVFASIVLLFARPFVVGDEIHIHSGAVGTMDVTVLGTGMTYVTVRTADGVMKIPNSAMLAAAIGQYHQQPASPPTTTADDSRH